MKEKKNTLIYMTSETLRDEINFHSVDGTRYITPEQQNRRLELDIRREEKKHLETDWSCCCAGERRTDSRLIRYTVQMTLITSIMILCITKLHTAETCEETNTFIGLLTLLIGLVLPQPSLKK